MEDVTCGLSELEIDQAETRFYAFWENVHALNTPGYVKEGWKPPVQDTDEDKMQMRDAEMEISNRDKYEAKVSEADLETVQLRYIPDFIRELKTKEEYWKKEFNYWGDLISKKNWKLYEKKVNYEMIRNKTVLKNFDSENDTHFSQSLDPERVQRLVDYIKEKEHEDMRFYDWLRAPVLTMKLRNVDYIYYAIFARYGDFRARPSRLNLLRAAEENSKNLLQN